MLRTLLLVALIALGRPGLAATEYWSRDALLADMFPDAETLDEITLQLTGADKAFLKRRLGYVPARDAYTFTVARKGGQVEGYVLFDEQVGKHEPITFAVQLTPAAVVVRQEVVVYREKYGSEVSDPRFERQFVGKGPRDELVAGRDVKIVSGATYSSRAMAVGVKRAIALTELLVARRNATAGVMASGREAG